MVAFLTKLFGLTSEKRCRNCGRWFARESMTNAGIHGWFCPESCDHPEHYEQVNTGYPSSAIGEHGATFGRRTR